MIAEISLVIEAGLTVEDIYAYKLKNRHKKTSFFF